MGEENRLIILPNSSDNAESSWVAYYQGYEAMLNSHRWWRTTFLCGLYPSIYRRRNFDINLHIKCWEWVTEHSLTKNENVYSWAQFVQIYEFIYIVCNKKIIQAYFYYCNEECRNYILIPVPGHGPYRVRTSIYQSHEYPHKYWTVGGKMRQNVCSVRNVGSRLPTEHRRSCSVGWAVFSMCKWRNTNYIIIRVLRPASPSSQVRSDNRTPL